MATTDLKTAQMNVTSRIKKQEKKPKQNTHNPATIRTKIITWLQQCNKHILINSALLYRVGLAWGEKCTKQMLLNIFISNPNTGQGGKGPFQGEASVSLFLFYFFGVFLNKHPKSALTGIPSLLQCMLVLKTLHQSPI